MVIYETKFRKEKVERYGEKMHIQEKEVNQDRLEAKMSKQKDKE